MSEMYTCEQVAQRYGVKVLTVWDWIRKKKLTAIKLGRDYRIRQEDIESFEQSRLYTGNSFTQNYHSLSR